VSSRLQSFQSAALVDTSAFYALVDPDDQWHQPALRTFSRLARERAPLVTSNLLVAETHRLVLQRFGRQLAQDWLASLEALNILFQTETEHTRTLDILRGDSLPRSYVDASALAIMETHGIETAFSFDRHFEYQGMVRIPVLLPGISS
jgi:predicted nucleic acid-binding protein